MSLDERSDALDKRMEHNEIDKSISTLLKDAARRKRQVRILSISVALDLLLTVGLGIVAYKTQETASLAQNNQEAVVANCETANDSREKQRTLWGYLLSISPEKPLTKEQERRTEEFRVFVDKTFAPRDCQAEVAK